VTVIPASAWMERAAVLTVVALAGILYFHRLADVPVYVSTDEAKFAVQAHAIATTGRDMRGNLLPIFVLIVDPLLPAEHSVAWWQPVLFYAMAGVYLVADVSAWSTRIPVTALAVLNVWLVFIVARRWLNSWPLALFAATALALTPAHFILGREAADYFCPTTVALVWLWSLLRLLDQRSERAAAVTGVVLGLGLYTYITSWVVMPMYLALTIAVGLRERFPIRLYRSLLLGFVICTVPVLVWTILHPSMITETLTHYHFSGGSRLVERITLYWDYFNPSYLFFAGGSNLLWSTRAAGVFLLAFIPLLLLGAWRLAVQRRTVFGIVLLIVFILVPLPIVLAMPEAPFYATARAILAVPFGVLIATAGLASLYQPGSALRTAAIVVLIASMPLQFTSFARDYFDEYPQRSAPWIDTMNFRGVADYVIASASEAPAVYLSHDDIGEDKAVKWKFHLLASDRVDLWERSRYLEAEAASRTDIAPGSVLILSAGNPRLSRLDGNGWSVATIVRDAAGEPAAAILRKR
jgi:4-amino-4-deoxy-L-arabinose transferase-like glycosyltransferase